MSPDVYFAAWEGMTDRRKSKEIHGEQAEGYFEQSEEEDPYTSAQANDCVYDTILANANKGRRKEGKSFIMNRPPAPAPRPPSPVIIQEERTPYIVQGNICWHSVFGRLLLCPIKICSNICVNLRLLPHHRVNPA